VFSSPCGVKNPVSGKFTIYVGSDDSRLYAIEEDSFPERTDNND